MAESSVEAHAGKKPLSRHNTVPLLFGSAGDGNQKHDILMEGYVYKQSGMLKKWKKKKLQLLPQQLIYSDCEGDSETPKVRAMALAGCGVAPAYPTLNVEPGTKDISKLRKLLAFKVQVKKGDFIFSAESMQVRNNWMSAIRNRDKKLPKEPSSSQVVAKSDSDLSGADKDESFEATNGENGEEEDYADDEEPEKDEAVSPTPPKRLSVQFATPVVEVTEPQDNKRNSLEIPSTSFVHDDDADEEVMAVMEKYNEQTISPSALRRNNTVNALNPNLPPAMPPAHNRIQKEMSAYGRLQQPNQPVPPLQPLQHQPQQPSHAQQSSHIQQSQPPQPSVQPPPLPPPMSQKYQQAPVTRLQQQPRSVQPQALSPQPQSQPTPPPQPQIQPQMQPQAQPQAYHPPQPQSPQIPHSPQITPLSPQITPHSPQITHHSQVHSPQHSPKAAVNNNASTPNLSRPPHTTLTGTTNAPKPAPLQPHLPSQPHSQTLSNGGDIRHIPTSPTAFSPGTPLLIDTLHVLAETSLAPPKNKVTSGSIPNLKEGYETFDALEDDWNNKYQRLVETEETTFDKNMAHGLKLNGFIGSFLTACKTFAKAIVDEFHVLPQEKAVPPLPIDADGEEMYIHNGILFRFAVDNTGELNDTAAVKVAGHELKGIKALMQTNVHLLKTALTCAIDYKGFRIVAIAIFPADGERTMAYGILPSMVRIDEDIKRQLKNAGSSLNLKDHVVMVESTRPLTVPVSSIVSAHRCMDNRVYVINLSRLFPPDRRAPSSHSPSRSTPPPPHIGPDMVTQLLRPEFVAQYSHSLSSDAFSKITKEAPGSEQCDTEVWEASCHLRDTVIPMFVQKLDLLEVLPADSRALSVEMHRAGINMRHLGLVAERTKLPHVRDLVVYDMIGRVCKNVLHRAFRRIMRTYRANAGAESTTLDQVNKALKLAAVDVFNKVLESSVESTKFWQTVLLKELADKFGYSLKFNHTSSMIQKPALFMSMQYQCGLEFDPQEQLFVTGQWTPLSSDCGVTFVEKMKHAQNETHECIAISNKYLEFEEQQQYEKAMQSLNLRLTLHKDLAGLLNSESGLILDSIAELSNKMGNPDYAQLTGFSALRLSNGFHADTAKIYTTLMETYYAKSDMDNLFMCFNYAQQIIKNHLGAHHPLILNVLNAMGKLFYKDQKYEQALEYYSKCLTLSTRVLGANHPHTAAYCNRVGHIYRNTGDFEKALPVYEKALLIHQTVLGYESLTVATSYFYLGGTLASKGDLQKALDCSTKSLAIRERLLGQTHPLTLSSCYQVAYIADLLDDYQIAIPYFERLLHHLKTVDEESALQDIQNITKAIIKLKFRLLPSNQKMLLDKARRTHNGYFNNTLIIERVIERLYDRFPSEYLNELFSRIAKLDQNAMLELACVDQLIDDQGVVFVTPDRSSEFYAPSEI